MIRKITIVSILVLLSILLIGGFYWKNHFKRKLPKNIEVNILSQENSQRIDAYINELMLEGKIPGLAIVLIKGNKTMLKAGYGYANVERSKSISSDTLFEAGSTTKAFTALGILLLEEQGLIQLDDKVSEYIPGFYMNYRGQPVDISIRQLLYQTGGIPFKSLSYIPEDSSSKALENTISKLTGTDLDMYPGTEHSYATINYSVLGLIIQKVSGKPFEQFMEENILKPLMLKNSFFHKNKEIVERIATGYKLNFILAREYKAPEYRGNTPAGYLMTSINDVETWLKLQLNVNTSESISSSLLNKAQTPDRSVKPNHDGSSYAAGWYTYQDGNGLFLHGGANPNYSSFFAFRPGEELAIGVLSNLNSDLTASIAQNVLNMMINRTIESTPKDTNKRIDNISTVITCFVFPFALITLLYFLYSIIETITGKRKPAVGFKKAIVSSLFTIIFISGFVYCINLIPNVFMNGISWNALYVWGPQSLIVAVIGISAMVLLLCLHLTLSMIYRKADDKQYFIIGILGGITGLGNTFCIFTINEALNSSNPLENGLFVYFLLGIALYVVGQKIVRSRVLLFTNEVIFSKRMELINRILQSPFFKIEEIEQEKMMTGLNNDTEVVSQFPHILISIITSSITLMCCFIYLGIVSFIGLLFSILIIGFAVSLYGFAGLRANKLFEKSRDIQNVFFRFINDLIGGLKELNLSKRKNIEFRNDMKDSCDEYKDKNNQAGMRFIDVFVIGELLFTIVIGSVAFFYPIWFSNLQSVDLKTFVLVFLYMTGPVNGVLNAFPQLVKIKISWARIKDLISELNNLESEKGGEYKSQLIDQRINLSFKNVEYYYYLNGDHSNNQIQKTGFSLGPLDCTLKSGQITFVTGGNGSGKSTLAKLLTGLYIPHRGQVLMNGQQIDHNELNQYCSAIFSDYHLFSKLYGIDHTTKEKEVQKYLEVLQIDDKLEINDGLFSTTDLSTGQKKRMALLVSYLEDRSICLFDEWAADQDPEFRKFYYRELLPELKKKGKCIVAISHDDNYFDAADQILKMEMGKIVDTQITNKNNRQNDDRSSTNRARPVTQVLN